MQESAGAGLGARLRRYREAKELSLEDLSRATRIVPRHLAALEEGRLRDLPAPVFVRGFIRSYCMALAESPDQVLALYEAWVTAAKPAGVRVPPTVFTDRPSPGRVRWSALVRPLAAAGLLVAMGGAIYLVVAFVATRPGEARRPPAQAARRIEPPRGPAEPTAPMPSNASLTTAIPARRTGATENVAAVPAPETRPRRLVVRVHEPTWLSVRAGDATATQEILAPGSVREWRSAERFTVTVGNAGGVTLELDGVALPPLGERGQVVREVRIPRERAP